MIDIIWSYKIILGLVEDKKKKKSKTTVTTTIKTKDGKTEGKDMEEEVVKKQS